MLDLLEKKFHGGFPGGARGQQLLMVSDFSGTHAGSAFTSYAFLSLDIDQNPIWLAVQREFRRSVLHRRRMAYKSLNDRVRRQALPHFLQLADQLNGALITDQDEVASNVSQLTQLTELFSRVLGHSLTHNLGHIRVGTTQSDDGTLALEDLAAIADLAAGALCEMLSAMEKQGHGPRKGIISLLPQVASPKARLILHWLASNQASLQRAILLLEKPEVVGSYKAGLLELHSITGNVFIP
jgi:hypothetical protein